MYSAERTYHTGRAVCRWQENIGWGTVAIGLLLAALLPFAVDLQGSGDGLLARMALAVPGLILAWAGMVMIMLAQHAQATMDTAEMTKEMLALARSNQSAPQSGGRPSRQTQNYQPSPRREGPLSPGDRVKVYKGREILKHESGVVVDGKVFANVLEAEKFVNDVLKGS